MGVYYSYCNLDRGEYFSIGLGSSAIKQAGIGRNLGARAFGLLLTRDESWFGQRVCVLGDDHPVPQELLEELPLGSGESTSEWLAEHFRDARAVAIRVLLARDAEHMGVLLESDDALLTEVAFFADHGDGACEDFLVAKVGPDWRRLSGTRIDYTGVTGRILGRALPVPEA